MFTVGALTGYKLYFNKVYFKSRVYASWLWDLNYRISAGKRALKFSYFLPLIQQRQRASKGQICPSLFNFLTHSTVFFPINPLDSQSWSTDEIPVCSRSGGLGTMKLSMETRVWAATPTWTSPVSILSLYPSLPPPPKIFMSLRSAS